MTITYRTTKGSALKYGEVDENFRDLLEDTTIDRVLGNGNTTTKALTTGSLTTGTLNAETLNVNSTVVTSLTVTGSGAPGGTGTPGQIKWDTDFLYICVATNTWKKVALEAV